MYNVDYPGWGMKGSMRPLQGALWRKMKAVLCALKESGTNCTLYRGRGYSSLQIVDIQPGPGKISEHFEETFDPIITSTLYPM